jgi:DNA-binding CsgD family transcriptional regulator
MLGDVRTAAARASLVGREAEIRQLRGALHAVAAGRGGTAMVVGEPGIGKSALLSEALAGAPRLGCELLWGVADELSQRFPLQVMLECLRVDARSADPYRAEISALLGGGASTGMLRVGDPVPAAAERMLSLVDQLCARSPVVVVVDDLQWADEASLHVWHRLTRVVRQLPLLVVGASGPVPARPELAPLRRTVQDLDGLLVELAPLADDAVAGLVTELVGAAPGVELGRLARQAGGNPLYVRELVDAVLREGAVTTGAGTAKLARDGFQAPLSLIAAVERRLDLLPARSVPVLRWAALLGQECAVADLALVTSLPLAEAADVVAEAARAGVVSPAGPDGGELSRLRFRHALTWRALYEAVPQAMRVALHRQAAQALADAGAPVERVAEQLLATPATDRWVVGWIAGTAEALGRRAPLIAIELIERGIAHTAFGDPQREVLVAHLVGVLFRLGRMAETEARARQALATVGQPERLAHVRWILGYVLLQQARAGEALDAVEQGLADPDLPLLWAARLEALRSLVLAKGWGDPADTTAAVEQAIATGERAGDRFAVAHALSSLFCVHAAHRQYVDGLAVVDRALAVLGDDTEHTDLRTVLLDHRVFILQNLDRLGEAEATLRAVRELADTEDDTHRTRLHIAAGVHHYWVGRWDDALAELGAAADDLTDATSLGLRASWTTLLLHGVAALIAGRRDDRSASAAQLQAGLALGITNAVDRDNCDFLLAATALAAERDGDPARALATYAPILDPAFGQTLLRNQWLPEIVRLALEVDDAATARAAIALCEAEAAHERVPARATAALARCRGLLDADPAALRQAVAHYRGAGRDIELAQTLEDLAVLLARQGDSGTARDALTEAVALYTRMGAQWDIRRAQTRARRYGVRRGVAGRRRGAGVDGGWSALTPTELRVALLVAEGRSNPEIAAELFLSRRTVQTHVQHILTKLGAHSRVEIAREAIDRGAVVPQVVRVPARIE